MRKDDAYIPLFPILSRWEEDGGVGAKVCIQSSDAGLFG